MALTPSRAVVAVLLGVAFIGGILALTAASHTVLNEQFGTVTSGADLAVRRAVAPDPAKGTEVARDPASAFNRYQLRAGRPPAADDEVVLDVTTALTQRIRLGETVVQGPHSATFRVVGLVGPAVAVRDLWVVLALCGVLVLAGLVVVAPAVVRLVPRRPRRAAPRNATELRVPEPTS